MFKDNFFEEILEHYKNLLTVSISLNFLFDQQIKDHLFEKLSKFELRPNIETLNIEDAHIQPQNLDCLLFSNFLKNIEYLKLPRNNLGDEGVEIIFTSDSLKHIISIDISGNDITVEGAKIIAGTDILQNLKVMDLRRNKI